jgi:hypothetical protein
MFHPMLNFEQKSFRNTTIPLQLNIVEDSKPRNSSHAITGGLACKNLSICTLMDVNHVNAQNPTMKFHVTHFILL